MVLKPVYECCRGMLDFASATRNGHNYDCRSYKLTMITVWEEAAATLLITALNFKNGNLIDLLEYSSNASSRTLCYS